MTINDLPASTPSWIVIGVTVLGIVYPIARWASGVFPSVAKALGPLGRRWRDREGIRLDRARRVRQDAREERKDRDEAVDVRIERLTDEVAFLKLQLDPLQQFRAYVLLYDTPWHLQVASKDIVVPPHLTFEDWLKSMAYHGDNNPRGPE